MRDHHHGRCVRVLGKHRSADAPDPPGRRGPSPADGSSQASSKLRIGIKGPERSVRVCARPRTAVPVRAKRSDPDAELGGEQRSGRRSLGRLVALTGTDDQRRTTRFTDDTSTSRLCRNSDRGQGANRGTTEPGSESVTSTPTEPLAEDVGEPSPAGRMQVRGGTACEATWVLPAPFGAKDDKTSSKFEPRPQEICFADEETGHAYHARAGNVDDKIGVDRSRRAASSRGDGGGRTRRGHVGHQIMKWQAGPAVQGSHGFFCCFAFKHSGGTPHGANETEAGRTLPAWPKISLRTSTSAVPQRAVHETGSAGQMARPHAEVRIGGGSRHHLMFRPLARGPGRRHVHLARRSTTRRAGFAHAPHRTPAEARVGSPARPVNGGRGLPHLYGGGDGAGPVCPLKTVVTASDHPDALGPERVCWKQPRPVATDRCTWAPPARESKLALTGRYPVPAMRFPRS